MRPKLVIFDVDGLLLDTEALYQKAWAMAEEKYKISGLSSRIFLKCVGRSGKDAEDVVTGELGQELGMKILGEVRKTGKHLLEGTIPVKPGAAAILDRVRELKIPRAVATATSRDLTLKRLRNAGLIDKLDYILCGDQITRRKPDPEIYCKVLEHFSVEPSRALVLEDSAVGVEAAYRAHIPCIMIPDLVPRSPKQEKETIAILPSLLDAAALIEGWQS